MFNLSKIWAGMKKLFTETLSELGANTAVKAVFQGTVEQKVKSLTSPRDAERFEHFLTVALPAARSGSDEPTQNILDWHARMQGDEHGPGYQTYPDPIYHPNNRRYGSTDEDKAWKALIKLFASFPDTDEGRQACALYFEWFGMEASDQERDLAVDRMTNDSTEKVLRATSQSVQQTLHDLGVTPAAIHDLRQRLSAFNTSVQTHVSNERARHGRAGLF